MKALIKISTGQVLAVVEDNYVNNHEEVHLLVPCEKPYPTTDKYYKLGKFVSRWETLSNELKLADIRAIRNNKLACSDFVLLRHKEEIDLNLNTTLTAEQYAEFLNLRKALRNITETANLDVISIEDIGWPVKPNWLDCEI